MKTALTRGYAASSTDGGTRGGGASFGLGHPEKVIDFGWRAMHETAVASKAIIAAFYGGAPKFWYFNGCSAGGRQAMKAAQRFPADFNGIIAGAPGLDWTGRAAQAVRIAKHLEQNEAARLWPAAAPAASHGRRRRVRSDRWREGRRAREPEALQVRSWRARSAKALMTRHA